MNRLVTAHSIRTAAVANKGEVECVTVEKFRQLGAMLTEAKGQVGYIPLSFCLSSIEGERYFL